MEINDFSRFAAETDIRQNTDARDDLMGLIGEVGEVAEIIKKTNRDDHGVITTENFLKLKMELGDIFWYLVRMCDRYGLEPTDVLNETHLKLQSRKDRGKLGGSGDMR